MLKITNKYNTALVYADSIDKSAEGLLNALCASPMAEGSRIRIMPDVHAGKGCAIGTTMTIGDYVAPGLVGVDIGCGILACKLGRRRLEPQRLDTLIRERVPSGRAIHPTPHRLAETAGLERLRCRRQVNAAKAGRSLGTLGGGNHFIEVDRDAEGVYWLLIHCGSRHLGAEVAGYYQEAAYKQSPPGTPYELAYAGGDLLANYLWDMQIAQEFAALNRRAIAQELARGLKLDIQEEIDTVHNYIDIEHRILRKGAVAARAGQLLLIPMNMRDGCLLCRGKGNEDWNCSAPHGAGRLLSRKEARESFTLSQYKKEMQGIHSCSVCRETLDESPMAYKPMQEIIDRIGPTVEILERLQTVYNFKAGGEH